MMETVITSLSVITHNLISDVNLSTSTYMLKRDCIRQTLELGGGHGPPRICLFVPTGYVASSRLV